MLTLVTLVLFVCSSNASRVSKVVGGKIVIQNSAPFMAEIQFFNGSKFNHLCGGAIIHPHFVLTAGHCLEGLKVKNVKVLVGTNDLRNAQYLYQADKFIIHSRY